ncbi:hypothetical protein BH24DEI2_BH24DEI2_14960 [soil metagenome]
MMPYMRGPSMASQGTTNDRITVHIAEDTTPAELQAVAREVASKFDLSLQEAEALLRADVIMLKQDEAEALVAICQRLGIRGKMTKPKPPVSRTARLGRQTLPWLLALLGVVVLVTLVSLMLPEVSVSSGTGTSAAPEPVVTEPVREVPVIETDITDTLEPNTETNPAVAPDTDTALPQIASATAEVESEAENAQQASASEVPVIASSAAAADTSADASADTSADPAVAPPDLFAAARDLAHADIAKALEATRTVDPRDAYGQTPLMYAAGSNSSAVVTALLTAGADVNAASDAGWTPLMYAARNTNDPAVVRTLLAAGADGTALNESGQGARDIALAYNNSAAAVLPAPPQPGTETSSAPETRSGGRQTVPARAVATPPASSPAPVAPATTGGGRPITITPRPLPTLSFPQPIPTERALTPVQIPVQTPGRIVPDPVPSSPTPSVQPAPAPEERDVILDCLQNWDTCGN